MDVKKLKVGDRYRLSSNEYTVLEVRTQTPDVIRLLCRCDTLGKDVECVFVNVHTVTLIS